MNGDLSLFGASQLKDTNTSIVNVYDFGAIGNGQTVRIISYNKNNNYHSNLFPNRFLYSEETKYPPCMQQQYRNRWYIFIIRNDIIL